VPYVGSGDVDITLPVASPDFTTLQEIGGYGIPRFWVDLLQQQSGKIRWTPIAPACVRKCAAWLEAFVTWMSRAGTL
jgi:hypothetical protein